MAQKYCMFKNGNSLFVSVVKPKCALETSKYGCCWDKKTEAKGFYGEGCPGE